MATDDRFAQITAVLALMITFGLFMVSHWSSIFSQKAAETVTTAPQVRQSPPAKASSEDQVVVQKAVVHATHELKEPVARSAVQAVVNSSARTAPDQVSAAMILQSLASGWKDATLPKASEILVRKDRDGRIVVASGTHRRYGVLLRDLEGLEPDDITGVLAFDQASSGTSLRDQLMDRIDQILNFELPEVEPDMRAGKVAWEFADESFRKLPAFERDLLLMGRSNAKDLKATLAEIRDVLTEDSKALENPIQHELIASRDLGDIDDETVVAP